MNAWSLPRYAVFGGVSYAINSDFRDVLEVIRYLTDPGKPAFLRWQIALSLFYDGNIPEEYQEAAMQYLSDFISYGAKDDKPAPKLIDWEQDAQLIVSDVNKVAGMEVRAVSFLHWWTFLSYFYSIGEGQLSTIVSIRDKKRRGKKLEKWEQEYYRKNKDLVDFQKPQTDEDKQIQDYFAKWL